jgi:hypothetical protein
MIIHHIHHFPIEIAIYWDLSTILVDSGMILESHKWLNDSSREYPLSELEQSTRYSA